MATSATGLPIISVGNCEIRVPAAGPFGGDDHGGWVSLSRCCGNVGPALMVVAGGLRSDEPAEGRLAGFPGVMADG
jgi:hypothetical protein